MRTAAARLNRPELRDTALILGLAGASWLLGNGALMHALQRSGPDHVAVNQLVWLASAAVGLAALAGRRRFPLTVVGITLAVTVLHMDGGFPPVAADLCVPVALYAVATTSRTVAARAALVLALATAAGWSIYLAVRSGHAAGALSFPTSLAPKAISAARAYGALVQAQVQQPAAWGGLPVLALVCLAAWFAGRATAGHRAYRLSAEQRAASLERQREQQAQLAVDAERTRIARELHDVVAHGLSVIAIQAQSAEASLTGSPDRARKAVQAIRDTSREALADMRNMLQVLRPATETPSYTPQPGLADLPALLAATAHTGRPVDLHVDGRPRPLPAGLDLSVYRIIQEALTNTLKHAGACAASAIRLSFRDDAIEMEITDTGGQPRPAPAPGGHGIAGMRERASLLGGTLTAGPLPGGGFRVFTRLPLRPAEPPP